VPPVFILNGQTLYSAVDAKPKALSQASPPRERPERPDVTVLVDHYEDDWSRLWWVSLQGRARVLDSGEETAPLARARSRYTRDRE
jgi:hypothetical protein